MFSYEMQQVRHAELIQRADDWRLAQEAKAARTAERRARRTAGRTAVRTGTAADSAASPRTAVGTAVGRARRALHPHGAA